MHYAWGIKRVTDLIPYRNVLCSVFAAALFAAVAAITAGCATSGLNAPPASPSRSAMDPNNPNAAPGAQPPAPARPSVKVAMLLPLSAKGQASAIAAGLKQAAELALFEQNNPNFQLSFKDTKGTAEGARAAITSAAADGVELVLGPLYGANVKVVAPLAQQARIPVIAFSNDRRAAGSGVYLLSFLAKDEVDRIVSFAARQGKQRFAALIPEGAYGQLVEKAFRDAVAANRGSLVAIERYPAGTNGMLEPSQRLFGLVKSAGEAGMPVDAIFLPGGPSSLPNLAPLVKYASIDPTKVKFLGTGGWDYPNIGRDPAFVGGWFPAPDPASWKAFSEKFIKAYSAAPPRIATLAYDAVSIAVALAASYPRGQRYTAANLTRSSGFVGVDGAVRFTRAGTTERALAVLEVQKFGNTVVDPAIGSFDGRPLPSGNLSGAGARAPGRGYNVTGAVR
ncbi:MAG: penicillin-binding protein activator [Hyphomicrobiaceae bacterium]|nr:penicillin-binding protein activator [Hyphomicrobiaceae bacterium]